MYTPQPYALAPMYITDWFNFQIWKTSDSGFWASMEGEAIHRGLITYDSLTYAVQCVHSEASLKNARAAPLTAYPEREDHELAHYIQADDKDLLDPFYGSTVFTFRTDQDAWFTDDDYLKELEVFVISRILAGDTHGEWGGLSIPTKELLPYMNVKGLPRLGRDAPADTRADARTDHFEAQRAELVKFNQECWKMLCDKWGGGLEQAWNEKERKDALFLNNPTLLNNLHQLQGRN